MRLRPRKLEPQYIPTGWCSASYPPIVFTMSWRVWERCFDVSPVGVRVYTTWSPPASLPTLPATCVVITMPLNREHRGSIYHQTPRPPIQETTTPQLPPLLPPPPPKMKPPTTLLLLPLLPTGALALSRTTPPSPSCLIVTKSPTSPSHYFTLTSALTALNLDTTTTPKCIFLYPGLYPEQVSIPSSLRTSLLSIYGSTPDTTTYKSNTVTVTSSLAQANGLSNDQTGTLRVPGKMAGGVRVYNVNVVNGYGKGSQAVAVSAQGDLGMYGCVLEGFQDTVLANEGRQVFVGCAVRGATDFVFGRRGRAW